jgi:hypothetical protein
MTTTAYPGYGSSLQIMSSPPVTIANIRKFNFPGLKADFEEISNLSSPTINKEYMKLMIDGGDMPFDGVFDPADPAVMTLWDSLKRAGNAALETFRVTFTDGSTLDFQAYVAQFSTGAEYNKVLAFTSSLKIVGDIVASWE